MRFEGFFASFSPSFDPVAHRSLTYSQCYGYIFLLPAFLFQFPRAFSSFFSPIGFLWCSHASYRITLDFLLPMSVSSQRVARWSSWPCPVPLHGDPPRSRGVVRRALAAVTVRSRPGAVR